MQTFKKNQIIITALVILIAIAGYLNFADTGVDGTREAINQQEKTSDDGETTPTALVPNGEKVDDANMDKENAETTAPGDKAPAAEGDKTVSEAATETDQTNDKTEETSSNETEGAVGEAVFTSKNSVETGHFLQAKIGREQGYAMLKEGYLALIDNKNLKEDQKVEAVKEMIDLQDRIEKEATAESLLEAKGFKDVFVRMLDGKVDVVINAKELTQAEMAQVEDIVRRHTGVDAENIVITLLDVNKAK